MRMLYFSWELISARISICQPLSGNWSYHRLYGIVTFESGITAELFQHKNKNSRKCTANSDIIFVIDYKSHEQTKINVLVHLSIRSLGLYMVFVHNKKIYNITSCSSKMLCHKPVLTHQCSTHQAHVGGVTLKLIVFFVLNSSIHN